MCGWVGSCLYADVCVHAFRCVCAYVRWQVVLPMYACMHVCLCVRCGGQLYFALHLLPSFPKPLLTTPSPVTTPVEVSFVEWPDRLENTAHLPKDRLEIQFEVDADQRRRIRLRAVGESARWSQPRLQTIADEMLAEC
jgi:hypothetical protein